MSVKKIKVLGVGSPILDILVNVDDSFISSIKFILTIVTD